MTAQFREIRAANPLSVVAARMVKLKRAGNEWKGQCPFHNDRSPSFTIFNDDDRFHCFGCGAGGDVLDYIQRAYGVSLREAAVMLDGFGLPTVVSKPAPRPSRDTIGEATTIWQAAGPIHGTPAEAYLRGRGLFLRLPSALRFAKLPYGRGKPLPCLIALVANGEDKIGGIQRTFVKEDGSGKADVPAAKLSLGRIAGGAIRLAPAATHLIVTGGLEDGLTLQQELGLPVWAATGEGNIAGMSLPASVTVVTIGADRDDAGELHARRAAYAFAEQGRTVSIIRPLPGFGDFNAELQGGRA